MHSRPRTLDAETGPGRGARSVRDDPDRAGSHGLAVIDRERAVGKSERAPDTVDARARLDPVPRLRRLEEVDGKADRGPAAVVVGVSVDRAPEREVSEGREKSP